VQQGIPHPQSEAGPGSPDARPTAAVSVAVPLYNEERNVPELVRRLGLVLDQVAGGPHQMVFVDDGSTDRSFELLREAAARDPRIVAVSLSRNFGHQNALSAALDHATGDVVVVMDGDLQDPPEAIPLLLAEQARGYDVVFATRSGRKEAWPLRLCYFVFYRLIASMADVRLPLDAGDFAVVSRRVANHLRGLPERQRYLRGLRSWVGFRQTGLRVERAERHAGSSNYGFWKLLRLAFDGIFAFSVAPLRAAAFLGAVTIGATLLYALYAVFAKVFLHRSPQGFTGLLLAVTLLGGIQLLFLGVIGEYIGRIYEESKGRPHYIVRVVAARAGRPRP
jgi:polyisoprenyl-phosphate glycosyltransferase